MKFGTLVAHLGRRRNDVTGFLQQENPHLKTGHYHFLPIHYNHCTLPHATPYNLSTRCSAVKQPSKQTEHPSWTLHPHYTCLQDFSCVQKPMTLKHNSRWNLHFATKRTSNLGLKSPIKTARWRISARPTTRRYSTYRNVAKTRTLTFKSHTSHYDRWLQQPAINVTS
jgi:hypothetical protein